MKISSVDFELRSGEIGYLIGNYQVWGKGYATEAITALSEFAFSRLGLTKLTAGAYSANHGSIRVLEKCGFQKYDITVVNGAGGNAQQHEVFRFALIQSS
jgi:[ribosomal protein S5]-alanine N-acetyltransferase